MKQRNTPDDLRHIKEFAEQAATSRRAVRYYEQLGLLQPSHADKSGYRLYGNADLQRLQLILSFRYLGFPLRSMRELLDLDAEGLRRRLTKQLVSVRRKQAGIERIAVAIERISESLQADRPRDTVVVEAIQFARNQLMPEWMDRSLTTDERKTLREIATRAYSPEALEQLIAQGWTRESNDQHRTEYDRFRARLSELCSNGCPPDSTQAEALVHMLNSMNARRINGNPGIRAGMQKAWQLFNALPEDRRPRYYTIPDSEREYLRKACAHFAKSSSS